MVRRFPGSWVPAGADAGSGVVDFVDPDWSAPLDVDAYLARTPATETIKGMFVAPVIKAAAAKGHKLTLARDRYLPFQDYPLREHMANLAEAARLIYPQRSIREGLRRLGRGALGVMLDSTVGRVVWAAATDPVRAIDAIVKTYSIVHAGCVVTVVDRTPGAVIVHCERVFTFLDCHHVGVFESALEGIKVEGQVKVKLQTPISGELLCSYPAG
ncbi:MAG: DUF2378 family protein [Polyangiales bacterium]